MRYHIFLSHSHRDNAFCHRVVDHIKRSLPDADIFYDQRTIIGGDEWMRRVQREIIERPIFIIILSPNSVESEWVREETNLAISEAMNRRERRIIPIRHQDCDIAHLAALLLNRQIIDCAQDESLGLRRLVDALQHSFSPERPPIVEQTLQHWHEVVWLCDNALAHLPRRHDILMIKANALRALRKSVSAPGVFDHAARMSLSAAAALGARGDVLWRLGRYAEAVAAYNHALQVNPNSPAIWYHAALALFHLGRRTEAYSACDKALQLDSNNSLLWSAKGALLYWGRRYTEAVHAYDQALRLNSINIHALNGRAMALWAQRRYAEAVADCEYVLALCPANDEAVRTRQFALYALGRVHEAEQRVPNSGVTDRHSPIAASWGV